MSEKDPDRPAAAPVPPQRFAGLEAFGERLQARVSSLVGRPLFWLAGVGLIFAIPFGRTLAMDVPAAPALDLPLPAFHLVDQKGAPFSSADLLGKVWVADFIFTSCPTACPRLTKRMAEVQDRAKNLADAFHLVSFTVDPENDTPERLDAFAGLYHVNPRRWTFATGSVGEIEDTVVKGFKIAMGKEESSDGIFSIFHGERLVLVDQKGAIRGYFDADDQGVDDLLHTVNVLINVP